MVNRGKCVYIYIYIHTHIYIYIYRTIEYLKYCRKISLIAPYRWEVLPAPCHVVSFTWHAHSCQISTNGMRFVTKQFCYFVGSNSNVTKLPCYLNSLSRGPPLLLTQTAEVKRFSPVQLFMTKYFQTTLIFNLLQQNNFWKNLVET